jgi:predicted O-linked N-acetylglucosamine transferase (SPINDLY family)
MAWGKMPISDLSSNTGNGNTASLKPSADDFFLAGRSAHMEGNLSFAEQQYLSALKLDPKHPDSLHLLGIIKAQQNKHQEAELLIRNAIAQNNSVWAFHDSLAKILQGQNKQKEAMQSYLSASSLKPTYVEGLVSAALIAAELGELNQCEALFRSSVERCPDRPDILNNHANALYKLGRESEAEASFREAIHIAPEYVVAYYNLGNLLVGQRRYDEAVVSFRNALNYKPDYPEALNNLGNILLDLKRFTEAESAYLDAYRHAQNHIEIITNLGNFYSEQKRFQEAESWFQRSLEVNPHLVHERVLLSYCKRQMCSWDGINELNRSILQHLSSNSEDTLEPLQLFSETGVTPNQLLDIGRKKILEDFHAILAQSPLVPPETTRSRPKIRIGYLSADFHEHATMRLLLGVLRQRNTSEFETWLYSFGPDIEDDCRRQARQACEQFVDIRLLSDKEAAERIAHDEIDILVDLKGYTTDSRLGISAWRPAPIIVSWLGYPGTLGHPRLADYIIGDPIVTPIHHASHFSETIAQLPFCYQPNDNLRPIGRKPSRQEEGLPENGFIFCSFNQSFKINQASFSIWCQLLKEIPDSCLWLLEHTPIARENLLKEAAHQGIAPSRLIFAKWANQTDHLGRLQLANLALDTFPYGSHTTGSDALWAGVPLVSLQGDTFASRVSSSLLHAVGLSELVAENWEDYYFIARRLASEPIEYHAIKERLEVTRRTSPLFDTSRFARDLENVYHAIWHQQSSGLREPIIPTNSERINT